MSDPYYDDFNRLLEGNQRTKSARGREGKIYETPPFPLNVLPIGRYANPDGRGDNSEFVPAIPGILTEPGRFTDEYYANPTRENGERASGAISRLVGGASPFIKAPAGSVAMSAARRDMPTFDLGDTWDLPMGNHSPIPAPKSVAAPAIKRADGEIFDYGHHRDVAPDNLLNLPEVDYFKSRVKVKPDSDTEKDRRAGIEPEGAERGQSRGRAWAVGREPQRLDELVQHRTTP